MPGIPINSLQDLLVLRELKNQANPTYSAMQALSQGVAAGIAQKQEEAKKKKEESERLSKIQSMIGKTNSNKIKTMIDKEGGVSYTIEPTEQDNLKIQREERLIRKQEDTLKQQELNNATKLRQEFINRPEVKDFVTVSTNVKAMEGLLNRALVTGDKNNLVAVDQGLITMYNKLTDPASVVRESEYARTPGNLPFINRLQGAIAKVQTGGAGLTNEDRKALVEGAKIIIKERGSQYNSTLNEYNDLAAQYGLDNSMVTRGMSEFSESTSPVDLGAIQVKQNSYGITREQAIAELKRRGKL